jgi:hypothetical protein
VPLASAIGAARLLLGLILVGGLLSAAAICAMKGKWVFFALGWFSGMFWIVGAMRLAKPQSRWAGRRYGDVALEQAQQRFSRRPLARLRQKSH